MMLPMHKGICKTCGVPLVWSKDSILDGDNTSLQKNVHMRGVFFEVDELANLIESLEEGLGIPLERICFAAHRAAIKRFIGGTVKGVVGSAATRAAPGVIFRQQAAVMPYFGVGVFEIREYRRGGPIVVEGKNVYNRTLFAADVAGSFEAVEGCFSEVEVSEEVGVVTVKVSRSANEADEYRGRLVPLIGTHMGTREYARCAACGAPLSFREFEWDRDRGEVRERDNGIRVVHQTAACIECLMLEMQDEIGTDVRLLATRAQADFVKKRIDEGAYKSVEQPGGDSSRRLFDFLSLIRRRCMGNPIFIRLTGDELTVHVRNPANAELIAGRVLGSYEAETGFPGKAFVDHSEGLLKVSVSPVG